MPIQITDFIHQYTSGNVGLGILVFNVVSHFLTNFWSFYKTRKLNLYFV